MFKTEEVEAHRAALPCSAQEALVSKKREMSIKVLCDKQAPLARSLHLLQINIFDKAYFAAIDKGEVRQRWKSFVGDWLSSGNALGMENPCLQTSDRG